MNQLKKLIILFALTILCVGVFSCAGNKETNEKVNTKEKGLFIQGPICRMDDTYSTIKGSVPRLHAMMCGKFVQYSTGPNPEETKYSTWLINEGQDSVVIYHIPVGDPNKEGYWMYNCQVMTSLPNNPLNATFSKLVEVSRDTIMSIYYKLPDDFDMSLQKMLEDPEKAFASIDLMSLKEMDSPTTYVRESILHYKGESVWYPDDREVNKGGAYAIYYLVRPQMMVFGTNVYDKEKTYIDRTKGERLMKNAMINPSYMQ